MTPVPPVTSQRPVGGSKCPSPRTLGQRGLGGSQESQGHHHSSPGLAGRAGRGAWAPWGTAPQSLSIPASFHGSSPTLAPLSPAPSLTRGGCHSLGSPQRDPGAAQEPQEPGGSRAEQSSLTQAAKRQTPAPAGSHPELGPARREPWHHGGVTSSPGRAQRAPSQRPAWPGGWASPWAS